MEERVDDLIANFNSYVDYLNHHRKTFVGPSVYFHEKTLAERWRHETANTLLQSDEFFDYLYATLSAWGLHRMGSRNTKLVDMDRLKASLRSQQTRIQDLWTLSLTGLAAAELPEITAQLWSILRRLKVSIAKKRLVANSKALHHVLPSLIPPIDRTYTYRFFYAATGLGTLEEKAAFSQIYERFHRIAAANKDQIRCRIGRGFHTSETKVIDNAIIGYVWKKLR